MSNIILGSLCVFFVLVSIWTTLVFHHRWGRKK